MSFITYKKKTLSSQYIDIHKDIIEKCKHGDEYAMKTIYELYSKAMYNICFRLLNNREEAEDMLQEAFIEAFKKLYSFRFESSFGAWIKQIVVNKCINWLKKKRIDLQLIEDIANYKIADESSYDEEQIQYEVKKVRQAVEQLPDGFRVIFSLYLFEGYDHVEISQILGISESTSKTQYMRAKEKVKQLIFKMN